eukprot:TRINITY_DN7689_c0_g4_i2.p1 TRINITY_DN7689_c0_g4~~TRINITY_DN7689_c0_g4_i2.p1  ORF type:complete len:350 (+),score=47.91 TRINITY_DN7689_c0_g4_i2:86-1135(+)
MSEACDPQSGQICKSSSGGSPLQPKPPTGCRPSSARSVGGSRPQSARLQRPSTAGTTRTGSNPSIGGDWTVKTLNSSRPQSAGSLALSRPHSAGSRPQSAGGSRPRSAGMTRQVSPGQRKQLPAEMGLAGPQVINLPSYVESCDQGDRCCWRWLSHTLLQECSWLKEDLDTSRKEYQNYVGGMNKAEVDQTAFAELRGAHSALLNELRESRHENSDLRRDVRNLQGVDAKKTARIQELERDNSKLEAAHHQSAEKEATASQRWEASERELVEARRLIQELKRANVGLEDFKARALGELKNLRADNDKMTKALEERPVKKKGPAGAKQNQQKFAMAKFKAAQARSYSARR